MYSDDKKRKESIQTMIIRDFDFKDLKQISRINSYYPKRRFNINTLINFLAHPTNSCLVADEERAIRGFLLLSKDEENAKILDVQVEPEHLERDITHLLCETAYDSLRQANISAIYK